MPRLRTHSAPPLPLLGLGGSSRSALRLCIARGEAWAALGGRLICALGVAGLGAVVLAPLAAAVPPGAAGGSSAVPPRGVPPPAAPSAAA
eukprot:2976135-Alexandrium_andersonii.AAC.1